MPYLPSNYDNEVGFVKRGCEFVTRESHSPGSSSNCITSLHTLLVFTLVQDFEKKEAEPRTRHFHSLSQDIVARSQKKKCGVCNVNSQAVGREL